MEEDNIIAEKKEKVGYVQVLRNHDFFALWLGNLISVLGNDFHFIALLWLVNQLTKSTLSIGIVVTCTFLPHIFFGLFAGVFVDMWNRKITMIICDIIRAILVLLIPILYYSGLLQIWNICVIVFLISFLNIFHESANRSIIPNLVRPEELVTANSISEVSFQLTNIFGSALAGILISIIGSVNIFFIDSFTYLFSALMIFTIRFIAIQRDIRLEGVKDILARVWEGLKVIKTNSIILTLLIMMAIMNFALGPFNVLTPKLSEEILKAGPRGLGFIMASLSVGMLIGAFLLGRLGKRVPAGKSITLGILIAGLFFSIFALSKNIFNSLILVAMFGFSFAAPKVYAISVIQNSVPDSIRGRIFSIQMLLASIMVPLSLLLSGWLGERVAPSWILFGCGLLMIVNGIYGYSVKKLREIKGV
ncbi:MAG: MFS transporter [Candidatus Humimicrobiia bacterium]